jgi:hypothetical protein
MKNRVKLKEMEGCSSYAESKKEPMEERDTYKKGLAVTKTDRKKENNDLQEK